MLASIYHGRRAVQIENDCVRVTATVEGGHIAEILHKATGVNPLWLPPWPTIEPGSYNRARHPEYGDDSESQLLSGILGHSICLDAFGPPSKEEEASGMGVHGEGPVVEYRIRAIPPGAHAMVLSATLPSSQLLFERRIELNPGCTVISISETVENLSATDRPVGWTEHVTLGPPFLEKGLTEFRAPATRSKVSEEPFNNDQGMQLTGAEFLWPLCPKKDGKLEDLRVFTSEASSGGFTAHVMDPSLDHAYFLAWSPTSRVVIGYVWRRQDFPWLSRWEENHLRADPPWNGRVLACGLEFGVSPMAETRRQMIDRAALFGVPGYRWIPGRSQVSVSYAAFITTAQTIPNGVDWDGEKHIELRY